MLLSLDASAATGSLCWLFYCLPEPHPRQVVSYFGWPGCAATQSCFPVFQYKSCHQKRNLPAMEQGPHPPRHRHHLLYYRLWLEYAEFQGQRTKKISLILWAFGAFEASMSFFAPQLVSNLEHSMQGKHHKVFELHREPFLSLSIASDSTDTLLLKP